VRAEVRIEIQTDPLQRIVVFPTSFGEFKASMKTQPDEPISLWSAACETGNLSGRFFSAASVRASLQDIVDNSVLDGRSEELRDRTVLIATRDQFLAAWAIFELDGIARRIVLCPPDLPREILPGVIRSAEADAVVLDSAGCDRQLPGVRYFLPCAHRLSPQVCDRTQQQKTEWVLLTSGTAGIPKLVLHSLATLTAPIDLQDASAQGVVWSTFYDIRRYGGLQILLRALLTNSSMVLSDPAEPVADFLHRAARERITHISGTPSHWRRALMSPAVTQITPKYVRLSGEIADDGVLAHLRDVYPHAKIGHAFASTEAGVVLTVDDVQAGFPASLLESTPGVEMVVRDQTLRVRSNRTAFRYLGEGAPPLRDADGFVDTADLVELHEGRYYFGGRRDGLINVGGLKVHPEEVEAVLNRHPDVWMSLVRKKRNPVTGSVVVADVVLRPERAAADRDVSALRDDILLCCRRTLSTHKVPVAINFVATLAVAESGKMVRKYA
jgi:acyl-coenzyme A synthetase/AMP-(fatty) acid ligase